MHSNFHTVVVTQVRKLTLARVAQSFLSGVFIGQVAVQ